MRTMIAGEGGAGSKIRGGLAGSPAFEPPSSGAHAFEKERDERRRRMGNAKRRMARGRAESMPKSSRRSEKWRRRHVLRDLVFFGQCTNLGTLFGELRLRGQHSPEIFQNVSPECDSGIEERASMPRRQWCKCCVSPACKSPTWNRRWSKSRNPAARVRAY